jgi:hypothetical protein
VDADPRVPRTIYKDFAFIILFETMSIDNIIEIYSKNLQELKSKRKSKLTNKIIIQDLVTRLNNKINDELNNYNDENEIMDGYETASCLMPELNRLLNDVSLTENASNITIDELTKTPVLQSNRCSTRIDFEPNQKKFLIFLSYIKGKLLYNSSLYRAYSMYNGSAYECPLNKFSYI